MSDTYFNTAFAIVYLIVALYNYRWFSASHSKGGKFEHCDTGIEEILFTFIPVINIIIMLMLMSNGGSKKTDRDTKTFNSFFMVKK